MNRIRRWEIGAGSGEKLSRFYSDLFGWEISDGVVHSGGIPGYIFQIEKSIPKFVALYVEVVDIEDGISRASSLGSQLLVRPSPSDPRLGEGRFAVIADPEGNILGLVEPQS